LTAELGAPDPGLLEIEGDEEDDEVVTVKMPTDVGALEPAVTQT